MRRTLIVPVAVLASVACSEAASAPGIRWAAGLFAKLGAERERAETEEYLKTMRQE